MKQAVLFLITVQGKCRKKELVLKGAGPVVRNTVVYHVNELELNIKLILHADWQT
jgi:hypothetical protein